MSKLQILKHFTIFKDRNYNTFPSMIKIPGGDILLAFRQAPDWQSLYGKITHIDPSSLAVIMTSPDGETWDRNPGVLYDDYLYGVQDPCLNLLKDGTIFCTFFLWKVSLRSEAENNSGHVIFDKWFGKLDKLYSIRSADGGKTWDSPIPILDSYRGGALRGNCTELDDGTILAPIYQNAGDSKKFVVARTADRGKTWEQIAEIENDDYNLFEPNIFRTHSGKLVAFLRTMAKNKETGKEGRYSPLLTTESLDNGNTWSIPVKRTIYSPSPFHVLQLESGEILLTYGCRIKPYGIRAVLLDKECTNFEKAEEFILRDDGLGPDLGYTSAVQLADGNVLIVYYYYDTKNGPRYINGSLCKII